MSKVTVTIPEDFILDAAASAWQTEGWSGKRAGFLSGPVVQAGSPGVA